MNKSLLSEFDNTKGIVLTQRSNEAIKLIKSKLRKTAETIIEIGELLVEAIDNESSQYKKEFYTQLGMSERSGQRYMQIAKNEIIKELITKSPKSLENMTMSDLLDKINSKTTATNKTTIEASQRAQNIFKRYKSDPKTLEEIITNLQNMLKNHNEQSEAIEATQVTSADKDMDG